MPWRRRGGRPNHASVLFGQPITLSEREKAQIDLDVVTTRREAAIVVAAVFALCL